MGRQLSNLSFETWIEWVFDHPPGPPGAPGWYWSLDADTWSDSPEVTLRFLTRLFENPAAALTRYSDVQIEQGLWFLTNNSAWEILCVLWDTTLPRDERERGIRSMYSLFDKLFARRCTEYLCHTETSQNSRAEDVSPLNGSCYMWWDNVSGFRRAGNAPAGAEDARQLDVVFLETMRRILDLNSIACIESGLHGLGHWVYRQREPVERVISDFLDRNPKLPAALAEYAHHAAVGQVQ